MANYKESTIPCTSYVRAKTALAMNPLEGPRFVQFQEETVLILPDGSKSFAPAGECTQFLTAENAATSFALRNQDGVETGSSMTYLDAYLVLMSLYYHVATERDENL